MAGGSLARDDLGRLRATLVVVARIIDLTELALSLADNFEKLLYIPDRIFLCSGLKESEAADDLFCFGEGAIGHGHLTVRDSNSCTQGCGQASLGSEQRAGLESVLDQLSHALHLLLGGRGVSFDIFVYA